MAKAAKTTAAPSISTDSSPSVNLPAPAAAPAAPATADQDVLQRGIQGLK